ncbi:TPA: hypothetical protein HA265_07070 [Candidatus Woesearchaeota archaeon]|nr:hypothetical protein [Candidatus Woesearchaeota archaeon]
MEIHPIAKLIVNKGISEFDGSMFSEAQRKEIFGQAAEIFFRQGKFEQGIQALEKAGLPLPVNTLKQVADKKMLMGQYQEAYALLAKIGDEKMAEFVRKNFMQ